MEPAEPRPTPVVPMLSSTRVRGSSIGRSSSRPERSSGWTSMTRSLRRPDEGPDRTRPSTSRLSPGVGAVRLVQPRVRSDARSRPGRHEHRLHRAGLIFSRSQRLKALAHPWRVTTQQGRCDAHQRDRAGSESGDLNVASGTTRTHRTLGSIDRLSAWHSPGRGARGRAPARRHRHRRIAAAMRTGLGEPDA